MMIQNRAACLLLLAFSLAATAQERTTTHLVGLGQTRLLDTYITQEHFSGTGFTYLYIREPANPTRHWNTITEREVSLSSAKDRSGNATLIEGTFDLYWGHYYHLPLLNDRLHLHAGAAANLCLGYLYDTTSSNNPAQARASLSIMPSAIAAYTLPLPPGLQRIIRRPLTLRYEANLPLIGLMFSPNYGQSYYEIFNRGNYDHNIVPTTPVSAPSFRQQLSIDWQPSRKCTLCIGYLGNFQQAQVNNLKQHVYAHRLMIGIVVKR